MMLFPHTAPSFKRARGAFGRKWLWWSEIQEAQQLGTIYDDSVERVKASWQAKTSPSQIHEQQGIETSEPEGISNAEFECWEGIYRWTKPGDKQENEWYMLVYRPLDAGNVVILRCQEYKPLWGDNWFYVPIICNPQPNSMWGVPLSEDLKGMQQWLNAVFQQSTDVVTMTMFPPVAVNATSQMLARNLKYGPGEKWALSNPATDVNVVANNNTALAGVGAIFSQINIVQNMAERVSNVGDTSLGKETETKKTAFEIGAEVHAGDMMFEDKVGLIQFGMDEGEGLIAYAENLLQIIRNFLPDRPIRYKSGGKGEDSWSVANPEMHKGNYRFIPHGNSANSNPELRMNRALAIRKYVMSTPFSQISPMDTPANVLQKMKCWYAAEREYVVSLGQKHPEGILMPEPKTEEEAMNIAVIINPAAVNTISSIYPPQTWTGWKGQGAGMAAGPAAGLVPPPAPGGNGANGAGIPQAVGVGSGAMSGLNPVGGMEAG
jgi:hypothetical protein